jgi:hypothetical protein
MVPLGDMEHPAEMVVSAKATFARTGWSGAAGENVLLAIGTGSA